MSRTPAVSVVIPVYNGERYVEAAIASIFAQTFTDWELIVVDDASTDGTAEFLRLIDDPRVRIVRNERNMNQAWSINRGVSLAGAPYVALQDADDLSLPDRLAKQHALLEGNPQIDVVGTGQYVTDRDLNPVLMYPGVADHASIVRHPTIKIRMPHHASMGRTNWWRRWPYDPRCRLCQDYDLLFRAHRETTFGNVPEPLYAYRFVGQTWSFKKYCRGMYYQSSTLIRHGFCLGLICPTLFALSLMLPRIGVTGVKMIFGKGPGLLKSTGYPPGPKEVEDFRRQLERIQGTEVPQRFTG